MSIKINPLALEWIHNEFRSGRTIEEISVDTGMSRQNVKRALAEAGEIYLSWYKTHNENELLTYLKSKGITCVNQLIKAAIVP